MNAGPPQSEQERPAAGWSGWGPIMWVLAAAGFSLAIGHAPSRGLLLIDAGVGIATASAYAAYRGNMGDAAWCFPYGVWSAAAFALLAGASRAAPGLPGGGFIGGGSLSAAGMVLLIRGGATLLLAWPYASRVLGMHRQPLWSEDEPVLYLTAVTIVAFFVVDAAVVLLAGLRS